MTSAAVERGVQHLREQIGDAAARGAALRIRGAGTWMDAGRPVDAAETLSTEDHAGIVAYVPGDLTMTVRAGTTLAEIRDAAAAHRQWLALDPHGSDAGTIGAAAATASAGPLATFFGTPRDLVLGVEFVTGAGAVARGGGRVVKNVAGFDLTRLTIGAWGSLGVVTEVTVRLHARPEVDRSFAIAIGDDDVGRVRDLLRRLPFRPYACEVLNAAFAAVLVDARGPVALVRLAGNADGVAEQRAAFAELGAPAEVAPEVWTRLRAAEPSDAGVVRVSDLPARIAATWRAANLPGALVHASPARGVARVIAPDAPSLAALGAGRRPPGATAIGERLPGRLWNEFAAAPSALAARVKQTFDPSNVLNRGILGPYA